MLSFDPMVRKWEWEVERYESWMRKGKKANCDAWDALPWIHNTRFTIVYIDERNHTREKVDTLIIIKFCCCCSYRSQFCCLLILVHICTVSQPVNVCLPYLLYAVVTHPKLPSSSYCFYRSSNIPPFIKQLSSYHSTRVFWSREWHVGMKRKEIREVNVGNKQGKRE